MGWFWVDSSPRTTAAPASVTHPSGVTPPPRCPMHARISSGSADVVHDHDKSNASRQSLCPIRPANSPFYVAPQVSDNHTQTSPSKPHGTPTLSRLNPLNFMFASISQERASHQTVDLPVDREVSSIPRGDVVGNWEYPSPQQMYNAMLRKGYTDTPQDAVESMVAVHNFLNEGAWAEIEEWEQIFSKGLRSGWEKCRRGSENLSLQLEVERRTGQVDQEGKPRLTRFQGRPQEPTPKARALQALGWVYPARFSSEPPFDRHDWYVSRRTSSGSKEVRYVIDYYSAPPEESGEPVFYLDIRPALDTPTAAIERLMRWGGDVWWRASGGEVRENR